jgi:hypothetical protein
VIGQFNDEIIFHYNSSSVRASLENRDTIRGRAGPWPRAQQCFLPNIFPCNDFGPWCQITDSPARRYASPYVSQPLGARALRAYVLLKFFGHGLGPLNSIGNRSGCSRADAESCAAKLVPLSSVKQRFIDTTIRFALSGSFIC